MKLLTLNVLFLACFLAGCSSMQNLKLQPEELQEQIKQGSLLKKGDKVNVYTLSGNSYLLIVDEITETDIIGEKITIPLKDIVSIETSQFDTGDSILAVGGTLYFLLMILVFVGFGAMS